MSASVAKTIEERRTKLEKQTRVRSLSSSLTNSRRSHDSQAWDTLRTERTDILDVILESLGRQLVPPDFHENSSDSSLFGSQDSEPEQQAEPGESFIPGQSPTLTIRHSNGHEQHRRAKAKSQKHDRSRWRSLRDFVDERAIEDALETIESERSALDV